MLTLRGFIEATDSGGWITPAERERAYRAAERLSGLTGEDACGSVAELRLVLDVIDRAETFKEVRNDDGV